MGRGPELEGEWFVLGLAREDGLSLVARRAVVEPDSHRCPRSNRDTQKVQDRPLHAERIRRSWEARECAAMALEEVAPTGSGLTNGEWWVTSLKKKQIPQA